MRRHAPLAVAVAALLSATAGCGGGGGGGTTPGGAISAGPTASPVARSASTGNGSIVLTIPNRSTTPADKKRRALYVSPSSVSLAIIVNSGTPVYSDVSPTSPLCTGIVGARTCTVPVYAAPGADTFSVNLYDAANGTGNLLAAGTASSTVAAGFSLAVVLQGVPASVALIPDAGSTITQTGPAAFALAKCFANQNVDIVALDADGNQILGPGAPTPTLASSDITQLVITAPTVGAPNTFMLTRSASGVPNPNATITLTATATPGAGGGAPLSATLAVTFPASTTICGIFTEYAVPTTTQIDGITTGSDGNLWFTEGNGAKLGRITTSGVLTEFPITAGSFPYGITTGPDGNLWFAENGTGKIGRMNPVTFAYTEFATATPGSGPTSITSGNDGALWFDEQSVSMIGRMTVGGVATDYNIPLARANPVGVVADPTGAQAVWFIIANANEIYQVSSAAGSLGTFAGPYIIPEINNVNPQGMTAGPDQQVWYTEYNFGDSDNLSHVSKINTLTHAITRYPIALPYSGPNGITAGPDGAMWFTEFQAIGRSTTAGAVTPGFPTPSVFDPQPYPITAGPGAYSALWYGDNTANKIGRLQ